MTTDTRNHRRITKLYQYLGFGLALLIFAGVSSAQPPDLLWTQTYGGLEDDEGDCVRQTPDGGYIVVGVTESFGAGDRDIWLLKLDADGEEEWETTFGGPNHDWPENVELTSDGGYIITGTTYSYGAGNADMWLIKTDANGNEEWNVYRGGSDYDNGEWVIQTNDGGYAVVGSTFPFGTNPVHLWLKKFDESGTELWQQNYEMSSRDYGDCVIQTDDGGFAICGNTTLGDADYNAFLLRTDSDGNELWHEVYGGPEYDSAKSLVQVADGGFVMAGVHEEIGYGQEGYLFKTDSAGVLEWERIFSAPEHNYFFAMTAAREGGYIMTGNVDGQIWLVKTDNLGEEQWSLVDPTARSGYGIDQTDDNGIIVTGRIGLNADDLYVARYDRLDLHILSPNGGESWRVGTTHTIEWRNGPNEEMLLELLDGAFVAAVISDGTANDGEFVFTIPEDFELGDNYRVRITAISGIEQDVSDSAFTITSTPTVTLTAHHEPIVIPSYGGGFWFFVELNNPTPYPVTGDVWTQVILPNGNSYGPLDQLQLTLNSFSTIAPADPYPVWVPAFAPAGSYDFEIHLGMYPNLIADTDSFSFEKLAGTNTASIPESAWNLEDWRNEAWETAGAQVASAEPLPSEFNVSPAYPNPFNASTSLTVSLPEATELSVTVYDVLGREVATLASGQFSIGNHRFTFESDRLASGLYFIRVAVPDHLNQVRKVMLVR